MARCGGPRQLGLLLWKNVLLKFRSRVGPRIPLNLLIEILWPLVLFGILAALRGKFPPTQIGDEAFHPYALPSAGAIPFLQSSLCTRSSGYPAVNATDMPQYNDAPINKVYSLLDNNLVLTNWSGICFNLQTQMNCFSAQSRMYACRNEDNSTQLNCTSQNSNRSSTYFPYLTPNMTEHILEGCSTDDQQQPFQILEQIDGLALVQNNIYEQFPNLKGDTFELNDLKHFMCGTSESGDTSLLGTVLSSLWKRSESHHGYERRSTNISSSSSSSSSSSLSLKVLFTPNTSCVRSVMRRANRTIAVAGTLLEWSQSVIDCSTFLLQNDIRNNITAALSLAHSLSPFMTGKEQERLRKADMLLNSSNPDNIWNTLTHIRHGAKIIHRSLSTVNWDIFIPVASEKELEEKAEMYQFQISHLNHNNMTVIAGLIFKDLPEEKKEEKKEKKDEEEGKEGKKEEEMVDEEEEEACKGISQPKVYIRMNAPVPDTGLIRDRLWRPGPENGVRERAVDHVKKLYLKSGFIYLQDMIERGLTEEIVASVSTSQRVPVPGVYIEEMPYPCYQLDPIIGTLVFLLPLAMIFAWMLPIAMTIRGIVKEKESRLREFMKMMGLGDAVLRLSWFLTSGSILFLSIIGITLILKTGHLLVLSNWLLLVLFLSLFALSMIAYSFLMSVLFTNANVAAFVGILIYFLVFLAHTAILPRQQLLSPVLVGMACLWSPLAYSLGVSYFVQLEMRQVGAQWSNIGELAIPEDAISIQTILVILSIDTLLYMTLVWYIEGVWPGKYGVRKPVYFPLLPSYWLGRRGGRVCVWKRGGGGRGGGRKTEVEVELVTMGGGDEGKEEERVNGDCVNGASGALCEDEPTHLPLGIAISHLSKTYSSWLPWKQGRVEAVKDLCLNFYEGQITAFLGQNGAGKTTTMSVITGLYEPTAGTARIYGNDIRTHMDSVRSSLGLCPQHNIVFDLLSVREHLLFYGMMRGLSYQHLARNIPDWLSKIGLSSHADTLALHLSGGMKRKLSILVAFVGEPRTVILDEPTAGVDPLARRQIWDFLLRHRDGRTIMLSTHHMDEAEILGDRIAILSHGSLLCCGSFEFLRHRYGRGHHLSLVTHTLSSIGSPLAFTPSTSTTSEASTSPTITPFTTHTATSVTEETNELDMWEGCHGNKTEITDLILSLIPSASLEECRGRELHFLLPLPHARPSVLSLLFQRLEASANQMGVASYGLISCSMEDIFVHLTNANQEEPQIVEDPSLSDGAAPHRSLRSMNSNMSILSDVRWMEGGEGEGEGEGQSEEREGDRENVFQEEEEVTTDLLTELKDSNQRLSGPTLYLSHILSLWVKRVHYTRRRILPTLLQLLLPLVLITLALFFTKLFQQSPEQQPLELTPSMYVTRVSRNYVFVGGCNDTWEHLHTLPYAPCDVGGFSNSPALSTLSAICRNRSSDVTSFNVTLTSPSSSHYSSSIFTPCGISARYLDPNRRCTVTNQSSSSSSSSSYSFSSSCHNEPHFNYHCSCRNCADSAHFPIEPPPCFVSTSTGTRVQKVTRHCGMDSENVESAYEMLISYLLRTKSDFVQERYGGVSFGHVRPDINASIDTRNLFDESQPFFAAHQAAKVWHTYKGLHSLPAHLNMMNNAILRANLPTSVRQSSYGIRTYSHPFAFNKLKYSLNYLSIMQSGSFLINPLATIFSLGFIVAGFVLILIEERSGKILHLQLVSGMSKSVYWVSTFLWDLTVYFLFAFLVIGFYKMFRDSCFTDPAVLPTIVLLLISYGAAVTPWVYCISFLFHSPTTAYIVIFSLNFFSGFSMLIVDAILVYVTAVKVTSGESLTNPNLLAVPFPSYALVRSLMYTTLDRPLKKLVASYNNSDVPHPLTELWPFVLSLWVQALVYTFIVVLVQALPDLCKMKHRKAISFATATCDDERVKREVEKVMHGDCKGDILTLRGLTKVYDKGVFRRRGKMAVNRLCLSMKPAQCFGLLGVNGAGKTTTFRMLTADTTSSHGDALVNSHSVQEREVIQRSIGYCPQVEALVEELTGREHLTFYSHLRGVPRSKVPQLVGYILEKLDLKEHADKPAKQYSGGNRRRLSTAIALLGSPQLLLLDEPTAGVDPSARLFLWEIIRNVVSAGQSVLLTTHSMAECEALCTRVGIMVNGSFRCLGTPQQLKSKYGNGYRLKLRVCGPSEPIEEFVQAKFPFAALKEKHLNTLVYQLPFDGLKLSNVFQVLETGRQQLEISDYSLSQTTLDDVFIHFANMQSNDEAASKEEEHESNDRLEEEEENVVKFIRLPLNTLMSRPKDSVNYSVLQEEVSVT